MNASGTNPSLRYSVVVPSYNRAEYILETIGSVVGQTETGWELIVVDDGSTDGTAELVQRSAGSRCRLLRQKNQGVSVARNTGLEIAQGEYVLFLDSDDILFPDALERLGSDLDEHPDAVLSYGTGVSFETTPPQPEAAHAPLRAQRKPSGEALALVLARNRMVASAVLARREAIMRVRGFEPGIRPNEDWVLWCDLAALGPIRYIGSKPVVGYRVHAASATRRLAVDPKVYWPGIDVAFAREAVRSRFTARERARLRRRAEASACGIASRELMRNRDWPAARRTLWSALTRDPTSVGDLFFLPFALLGWLPRPLRQLLD
jgi:glycosyltransferase involved in cell wall biosynthesis